MSTSDITLLQLVRRIVSNPIEWATQSSSLQLFSLVRLQEIQRSQVNDLEWFIYRSLQSLVDQEMAVSEVLDNIETPIRDLRFYPVIVSIGEHLIQHRSQELVPDDELWLRNKLGNAYAQIPVGSRYDHQLLAVYHYQKAIELCPSDTLSISQIMANLGNVFHEMLGRGRYVNLKKAQECLFFAYQQLQQAKHLQLVHHEEYNVRKAMIASSIGNVLRDQQSPDVEKKIWQLVQSEDWLRTALESAGNDELLQAQILRNHAVTFLHRASLTGDRSTKLLAKASKLLDQSYAITSRHELPFWNALCSSLKACVLGKNLSLDEKEKKKIRELFSRAGKTFDSLGHRREAVTTFLNWGIFEESHGALDQSWKAYREAIFRSEEEWRGSDSMSAKLAWAEQYADAIDHYTRLSSELVEKGDDKAYSGKIPHTNALREQCLTWLEKSSARLMTEWTFGLNCSHFRSASEALQEHLDPTSTLMEKDKDRQQADVDKAKRLESASLVVRQGVVHQWSESVPISSESGYLDEEQFCGKIYETVKRLGHPLLLIRATSSGTVCSLVQADRSDCHLIKTFNLNDLSDSLRLWSESLRSLHKWIRSVQNDPHANDFGMQKALSIVGQRLLHPLWGWIQKKLTKWPGNLTIVPGPGLGVIPLDAAMSAADSTADSPSVSISYTANVRILQSCLQQKSKLGQRDRLKTMIVSNPTDDLPFGTWEKNSLLKAIPGQHEVLAGYGQNLFPIATRQDVIEKLKSTDIAVFATHARFDPQSPWYQSEIRLAYSGVKGSSRETRAIEMLDANKFTIAETCANDSSTLTSSESRFHRLSLGDLFDVKLRTSLVVLSACESALTDCDDLANENFGFPSVFIAAGARTVIGSLWKVDDRAAALFSSILFNKLFTEGTSLESGMISRKVMETQNEIRNLTLPRLQEIFPDQSFTTSEHPFQHPIFWSSFACFGAP